MMQDAEQIQRFNVTCKAPSGQSEKEKRGVELPVGLSKLLSPLGSAPDLQRTCEIVLRTGWHGVIWQRGFTGLHLAAKHGNEEAVRLLLHATAAPALAQDDFKHLKPIDYARTKGFSFLLELLDPIHADELCIGAAPFEIEYHKKRIDPTHKPEALVESQEVGKRAIVQKNENGAENDNIELSKIADVQAKLNEQALAIAGHMLRENDLAEENRANELKYARLKARLAEKGEEIKALVAKETQAHLEFEEMKSDLQTKFYEKEQRYVAKLNDLKEQNASQREMIDAKEAELFERRKEIEAQASRQAAVLEQVEFDEKQSRTVIEERCKALEGNLSEMEQRLSDQCKQLESSNSMKLELEVALAYRCKEIEERIVKEVELETRNRLQNDVIALKQAEIEAKTLVIEQNRTDEKALVEQINTLEARLREAENESEKKRLDHERGLGAMAELDAISKERSKEIDEYARKQSALEAQVANQEKMLAAKHAEMESKLSEQSSANEQILAKENNTLQTRISELEKKCSNQLEQLDASALKHAEREAKLLEQSSANEMLAEENKTLQRKVSELEKACSEQTQELETSAQKHGEMEAKLLKQSSANDQMLADENSRLLTTTSNLEKTCSDQSKELEASALKHAETEAKLLERSSANEMLAEENKTLQRKVSDLEKMCSEQTQELESSAQKHGEMEAKLLKQSSANDQMLADENSRLQTTISNLEKTRSDQSKELEASALRHGEMEAKLLQSSANEQRLAGENSTLQMRISDLGKKCSDESTELEVSSELKHAEVKAELSEQSGSSEEMIAEANSALQMKFAELEKKCADQMKELEVSAVLRSELAGMHSELAEQRKRIEDNALRESDLQAKLVALERELKDSEAKFSEMEKGTEVDRKKLEERIARQKGTIDSLTDQVADLTKKLEALKDKDTGAVSFAKSKVDADLTNEDADDDKSSVTTTLEVDLTDDAEVHMDLTGEDSRQEEGEEDDQEAVAAAKIKPRSLGSCVRHEVTKRYDRFALSLHSEQHGYSVNADSKRVTVHGQKDDLNSDVMKLSFLSTKDLHEHRQRQNTGDSERQRQNTEDSEG